MKSSSQATTSSVYDDFDDEPSSCPDKDPVFKRSIRTSKGYGRESITAVKITKQHKPVSLHAFCIAEWKFLFLLFPGKATYME